MFSLPFFFPFVFFPSCFLRACCSSCAFTLLCSIGSTASKSNLLFSAFWRRNALQEGRRQNSAFHGNSPPPHSTPPQIKHSFVPILITGAPKRNFEVMFFHRPALFFCFFFLNLKSFFQGESSLTAFSCFFFSHRELCMTVKCRPTGF